MKRIMVSYWKPLLFLLFVSSLVFAIYSNTLQNPFMFDDMPNIIENKAIQLKSLSPNNIKRVITESYLVNRPVSNLTLAANYYFNQERVLGYRVVNILIHLINGVLLYIFVKLTLGLPALRSRYTVSSGNWIACATALIWLLHPIQTNSVTYVIQRMNSLAALFYLLTFILYVKGRLAQHKNTKWAFFLGSVVSFVLALGSKEMVVVLPFIVVLYEWYFFQELNNKLIKGYSLVIGGLVLLTIVLAFIFMGTSPIEYLKSGYAIRDFNPYQRVLTEFRVVISYIFLLLFPHPSQLNFDHHFIISTSLVSPLTTLFSFFAIAGSITLAVIGAKKERLLSFCILWYFINLVVESSVIGLELVFEHRTYIPSMFAALLVVTVVDRVLRSTKYKVILLSGVLVFFSFWTYERNKVWQDRITLWEDSVKKSSEKTRTLNGLGVAHYSEGNFDEAIRWHQKALQLNQLVPNSHYYLANALKARWRLEEAAYHYSMAIRLLPEHDKARYHLSGVRRMIEAQKKRKKK